MSSAACPFEEILRCPVCRDVFRDPVLLLCSHSFCWACVDQYWEHSECQRCPVCRADSGRDRPPCNRALRNLCEIFRERRSRAEEMVCGDHGEKMQLFCPEDQRLLCGVCVNTHLHHTCIPVDEAAEALKEMLKIRLKPLQENLKLLQAKKFICNQRTKHIKDQAEETEAHIKKQFEHLRQFLRDEEVSRISALREEEEQKRKVFEDQIERINSLEERMRIAEEDIESSNIMFLLKYRSSSDSPQCSSPCAEKLPELQIDVAKHLGNLKFGLWQKMRTAAQYFPVVLDPNTAHPCLSLSEDLSAVSFGRRSRRALRYMEKHEAYSSVLGSEGFSSGNHSWDIEVGDNTTWALGVISESAIKTRDNPPSSGLWRIGFLNGKYGQGLSGEFLTPFTVKHKIQIIRVQLDWDGGKLSFFDSLSDAHLYSFEHSFSERVFPYFCNACPSQALRILPLEMSVAGHKLSTLNQCDGEQAELQK